jgi:hypothetical protein
MFCPARPLKMAVMERLGSNDHEREATMTRGKLVTFVLGVAWMTTQGVPAEAAQSPAVCHVEVHATATPGVWATRSTEGSTSQAKPGTITCTGVLDGRELASEPGPFSMAFSFGSTGPGPAPVRDTDCFHGWTKGQWSGSIPTVDGHTIELGGPFGGAWTGLTWRADGRLGRHTVAAVGQTRGDPDHPDEDCVTTAFEHFIDTGQLAVSD